MAGAVDFVVRQGEVLIFVYVFADQIGIPVPAVPGLLAIGALAAVGKVSVPLAVASAVGASLLADVIWYGLGRRRGSQVLASCVGSRLSPIPAFAGRRTCFYAMGSAR